MKNIFSIASAAGLVFGGLVITGIAFGPATTSVLTANFSAAGNGIGAIANGLQTGAGFIAGTPTPA